MTSKPFEGPLTPETAVLMNVTGRLPTAFRAASIIPEDMSATYTCAPRRKYPALSPYAASDIESPFAPDVDGAEHFVEGFFLYDINVFVVKVG